ncbi:MAG: D-amino-acid transaminase [Alphaproteobacteria bacterium]
MSRIAYVNGRYVPHRSATVHVEDRGYQFADGVYEVIAVNRGRLVDGEGHFARLDRSLAELRIAPAMSRASMRVVIDELLRRNGVDEGIVYIQMTRGVAPRDHAFPKASRTAVVMTARKKRPPSTAALEQGVRVITIPDIRWSRCDIKSVSLLPNVLGKQRAVEAGAFEAWQVDKDGMVTEGTSTNAWIVTAAGELVTRQPGEAILNGITRLAVLEIVRARGLSLLERPFSLAEAKAASEAFITSTTSFVLPVVRVDDAVIGGGAPGPVSQALRARYVEHMSAPA